MFQKFQHQQKSANLQDLAKQCFRRPQEMEGEALWLNSRCDKNPRKVNVAIPHDSYVFKAIYHISGIAKKISGTKRSKSRNAGYDNNFHEIVE